MEKKICNYTFLFFITLFSLSSCVQQKQIAYFQKTINQSDTIAVAQVYIPKIQPGDILDIKVGSLNPVASSFFNPFSTIPVTPDNNSYTQSPASANVAPVLSQTTASGYLVDNQGNIEYPILGVIKIAGLTTSQARDTLQSHLKLYLKGPTVNVRFLNYKISVMGEVAR